MRKVFAVAVVLAAAATVGACAHKQTPDEFAVARNAPLIVPPDFNLAPPVAGTAGISAGEAQQQAIDALFGGPAPRPLGEMSMLDVAGRDSAQLGIRSTVRDPNTRVVDKGPMTVTILNAPQADSSLASAQAQ
ncbi:hypothetical protein GCM10022276_14510 [Sphingomonas limnosediminicola]|jgi:hypothetical protein|uniref:DUF3035 domain-containing protein n=1 Tax=Sphingomonas limnosediminicola TaxID=940133 RepID=A0ABP7L844_9SPHN